MTTIDRAVVTRHGTALGLGLSGGGERVIRRVDVHDPATTDDPPLAPAPWPRGVRIGRRFAAAEVVDGDVRVRWDDGDSQSFSAADLLALLEPRVGAPADRVVANAGRLVTAGGDPRSPDPLGVITDGAVVCRGGRVAWIGASADLPACGIDLTGARRIDAGGRLVTPGLVDCHAHPLFGGDRAGEYARRARGEDYLAIAAAGGGIQATLEPTRAASFDAHVALTAERMARALAAGTTTCEAKSGYDLTADGELRLLEVARAVDALSPVDLVPTLLGAHVLPPEYAGDRAGYVALVTDRMIPEARRRGLTDAVDVYCDQGAFTLAETRQILTRARAEGMRPRAHVGQFSELGGAELLAELGGASADHLEQVSAEGMARMAAAGVVAVMLPGACVQVRCAPPPVARLRAAGVALAVASDLNPGTSLCDSLPVQMWLATTHYGMSVEEAWLGVTRVAARVLGKPDIGVLKPGARADIVLWDAGEPAEVPYRYGANLVHAVIKDGRVVVGRC